MNIKNFLYNKGIWLIISIFAAAKILFLFKFHSVIWDEAVYIGMGKYLWSFGTAGLVDLQRPLLLSLVLGFIWKIGINPVIVGEIMGIIFSTALVFMSYLIGLKLFDRRAGLIASVITATLPLIIEHSSYILTDIPSVLFAVVALYFVIAKRWRLVGLFSGISFLFRFPHILVLFAIIGSLILSYLISKDKKTVKNIGVVILFFILTISPWLVFNIFHFDDEPILRAAIMPLYEQNENIQEVGKHYDKNISFYTSMVFGQNMFLMFIFIFVFAYIKEKWYKKISFNSVVLSLVIYLIYFTFFVFNTDRYAISFISFLIILASIGTSYAINILKNKAVISMILILFTISAINNVDESNKYYSWRYSEEPAIYSEYYEFFVNNQINGTIFTTDPVHAAYSENKFIANSFLVEESAKSYEKNKKFITAFIYAPRSFPCLPEDVECENKKKDFFNILSSDNELIFNRTYDGNTYYIFKSE